MKVQAHGALWCNLIYKALDEIEGDLQSNIYFPQLYLCVYFAPSPLYMI
jgi:hypothetical protein